MDEVTAMQMRAAALAVAAQVHQGLGSGFNTVLQAAEKFESYIMTGAMPNE